MQNPSPSYATPAQLSGLFRLAPCSVGYITVRSSERAPTGIVGICPFACAPSARRFAAFAVAAFGLPVIVRAVGPARRWVVSVPLACPPAPSSPPPAISAVLSQVAA